MGRRHARIIAIAASLFLIVSCSCGSTSASESADANAPSGWVEQIVDSRPGTGQSPKIVIGPRGEIGIAYLQQLDKQRSALNWSYCQGTLCDTIEHSTLGVGSLHLPWRGAAAWSSDALVVLGGQISPAGTYTATVWSCDDTPCGGVVGQVLGNSPLGLIDRQEGLPVIAWSEWSAANQNYRMTAGFCDDAACSSLHTVPIYTTSGAGYASPEIKVLPDGSPVVFMQEGVGPGDGPWTVVVCTDPDCSRTTAHHYDPSWNTDLAPAESDLPYVMYTAGAELRQLYCADQSCSTVLDRTVTAPGATDVGHAHAVNLADDLFVLYQTSTGEIRSGYMVWDLNLLRCRRESCERVEDVPFAEGFQASMGRLGESTLIVAVQSGRPELCFEEFESCGNDPRDDSRLTLYIKDFAPG